MFRDLQELKDARQMDEEHCSKKYKDPKHGFVGFAQYIFFINAQSHCTVQSICRNTRVYIFVHVPIFVSFPGFSFNLKWSSCQSPNYFLQESSLEFKQDNDI